MFFSIIPLLKTNRLLEDCDVSGPSRRVTVASTLPVTLEDPAAPWKGPPPGPEPQGFAGGAGGFGSGPPAGFQGPQQFQTGPPAGAGSPASAGGPSYQGGNGPPPGASTPQYTASPAPSGSSTPGPPGQPQNSGQYLS